MSATNENHDANRGAAAECLAPHPPLPGFYSDNAERERFVDFLFDEAAADYERLCAMISFGTDVMYRKRALLRARLRPGMRVLDVATGTGFVTRAALALGVPPRDVVGLDPSRGMLAQHQRRHGVALAQGRGEHLPFADGTFDFVVMGYALRHVPDLCRLFGEFHRVIKPGGRALVLEISRPESRMLRAAMGVYLGRVLPLLARWTARREEPARLLEYYWATIDQCVAPAAIVDALAGAGFAQVRRTSWGGLLNDFLGERS